jgi:hypothetical protein
VLFTSFVGQMLQRSLICCRPSARKHFGAMYSPKFSHRDRPMMNTAFLQAITQKEESRTAEDQWGTADFKSFGRSTK